MSSGAMNVRRPSASSTIASANDPNGDCGQRPITTRRPAAVPNPQISPVKRSTSATAHRLTGTPQRTTTGQRVGCRLGAASRTRSTTVTAVRPSAPVQWSAPRRWAWSVSVMAVPPTNSGTVTPARRRAANAAAAAPAAPFGRHSDHHADEPLGAVGGDGEGCSRGVGPEVEDLEAGGTEQVGQDRAGDGVLLALGRADHDRAPLGAAPARSAAPSGRRCAGRRPRHGARRTRRASRPPIRLRSAAWRPRRDRPARRRRRLPTPASTPRSPMPPPRRRPSVVRRTSPVRWRGRARAGVARVARRAVRARSDRPASAFRRARPGAAPCARSGTPSCSARRDVRRPRAG